MPLTATQQAALDLQAEILDLTAHKHDLLAAMRADIAGYVLTYKEAREAREAQYTSDAASTVAAISAAQAKLNSRAELEKL